MAASAATTASLMIPKGVFAQGSDVLTVGVIGCGGRGTGAVFDCLNAHPRTVLWAMGDLFPDRLAGAKNRLDNDWKDKSRIKVTEERMFSGFDAYRKVLATECDIVILATPPGFRPIHFEAAVRAGKHIFTEKPVATDAPGVRRFLAAAEEATRKRLNVVAGTQRRHHLAYRECMKRIHDGQMGEITSCNAYWNQGGLWKVDRKEGMSDAEWQIRNWLYFTWTSGDIIVEQHIHNIDVCNWAMRDHPVKALSLAGRQVRTDPVYGHIFDHFATEFEYANGVKMVSMCRQIDNTASRVSEHIVGTKGTSNAHTWIRGENPWRWEGGQWPNEYMLEHRNLIRAILGEDPYINEGKTVAETTLTAIMGRMAGYTGQEVTWEQAMNSQENLFPEHLEFGPLPTPGVAMPGKTTLK